MRSSAIWGRPPTGRSRHTKAGGGVRRELLGVVRPRWAARTFELTPEEGGVRLSSGLLLPGEDLKRHLAGCRRAVLFCATLSAQADALIRRAESGDMLRALALDRLRHRRGGAAVRSDRAGAPEAVSRLLFPIPVQPGVRGSASHPSEQPAGPAGRPRPGGTVCQRQPYPHPAQVGDRHSGGGRPSHSSLCTQLSGLSRTRRLPISKVRWTLWNFLNC